MGETMGSGSPRLSEGEKGRLLEAFADRAYKGIPGGANLTTLNAADIIERMHYVFGHGNFAIEGVHTHVMVESEGQSRFFSVSGEAVIYGDDGRVRFSFPYSGLGKLDCRDLEYEVKGAHTAYLNKALFVNLLIGLPMYKGLIDVKGSGASKKVLFRNEEKEASTPPAKVEGGVDPAVRLARAELRAMYAKDASGLNDKLHKYFESRNMEPVDPRQLNDEDKVDFYQWLKK